MQVALSKKSPYLQTSHRVSGLMLANHTGVRHLFDRSIAQFDRLIKRKAFIDNYKVCIVDQVAVATRDRQVASWLLGWFLKGMMLVRYQ